MGAQSTKGIKNLGGGRLSTLRDIRNRPRLMRIFRAQAGACVQEYHRLRAPKAFLYACDSSPANS